MSGMETVTLTVRGRVRTAASELWDVWRYASRVERIAYVIAAVLLGSGLAHIGILLATGASWEGPVSLRKAATFGLSFGLTLLTVTWAGSYVRLSPALRAVLLSVFSAACVMETFLVSMQAWRGVPSHFNFETPFDTTVAMTLAGGGAVLIVTILAFTTAALRAQAALSPGMRFALRYGFVTLLGALVVGALMIANGVTLVRSGDPAAAYLTAGALKPLHAVTMHAILVLPGIAWLLRFTGWTESRRLRIVQIAAAAYTVAIAIVAGSVIG